MVTGANARGLWPFRRFLALGDADNMPDEAFGAWTFAFLEEVPMTHATNPEFPHLWDLVLRYFTTSYYRDDAKEIVLLRFDARTEDGAFVINKAPLERLLYSLNGVRLGPEHRAEKSHAYQECWATKTPLDEYQGDFSVPEVIIKNPIAPERLEAIARMAVEQPEY